MFRQVSRFAKSIVCLMLAGFLLSPLMLGQDGQNKACAVPAIASDDRFQPGQVWSYKARTGESSSTLTILRLESLPKVGIVIHVRVDGIHFKSCSGGPEPNHIQHAPFSRQAIADSVIQLLSTSSKIPEYEAGYQDWLAHCGGAYTSQVAAMLDVDEATFRSGTGCQP
jgi:hypothetical protein